MNKYVVYLHHRKRQYKQLKNTKMKSYNFIYLDKSGNELRRECQEASNLKEAKQIAIRRKGYSMLADLSKIQITCCTPAMVVCFENRYFNLSKVVVLGTTSEKRAIKAAKENEYPSKFDFRSCYLLNDEDLKHRDLDYAIEISK